MVLSSSDDTVRIYHLVKFMIRMIFWPDHHFSYTGLLLTSTPYINIPVAFYPAYMELNWVKADDIILSRSPIFEGMHSISHIKRAVEAAETIIRISPLEYYDDIVKSAFIHDIQKIGDNIPVIKEDELARPLSDIRQPKMDIGRIDSTGMASPDIRTSDKIMLTREGVTLCSGTTTKTNKYFFS